MSTIFTIVIPSNNAHKAEVRHKIAQNMSNRKGSGIDQTKQLHKHEHGNSIRLSDMDIKAIIKRSLHVRKVDARLYVV